MRFLASIPSELWAALGGSFPTLATMTPAVLALVAFFRNAIPSEESFETSEKILLETLVQRLCDGHRDVIVWTVNYTFRPGTLESIEAPPQPAERLSQELIRTCRAISRIASIGERIRGLHHWMIVCVILTLVSVGLGAFFNSFRPVGSLLIICSLVLEVSIVFRGRKLRSEINAEHERA